MLDPDISTAGALHHLSAPESAFTGSDAHALDRRRFLQLVGMGLGAGAVAGPGTTLLDSVLGDNANTAWAAGPIADDDGILVVLGMYGGNDGLNTVVPITDGLYYDQRGELSIPAGDTLPINSTTGLNPELTEFKAMWDAGQLAIVEGVGYADPDLSHFNSMAKWMSGYRTGVPTSGWVGRWLDGYLNGSKDLFAAAEVGYSLPLHMIGQSSRATAIPAGRPSFGAGSSDSDQRLYQAIRSMGSGSASFWQNQVHQAFVDQLDVAKTIAPQIPEELPETEIVARMEVAARLINANLGFRVLTAGFGDFDSHSGQAEQHTTRMSELNSAIQRFFEVLDPSWARRVTFITFSEFGRTIVSEDGDGSDHGTSAPHFVFGANVKGGMYGQRPTLAGLERWDRMAHHVDYRDYFGSVLDGWMGGGGSDVFGKSIANLDLFDDGPGVVGGFPPELVGNYVALSPTRVYDTRDGNGGRSTKVGPGETVTVRIGGRGGVPASGVSAVALNVTAAATTRQSFLTVFPANQAKPGASNVNTTPERAVANMVVVGVSPSGDIKINNDSGSTHCIVDVSGYFSSNASTPSQLRSMQPARLLDTRIGTGAPKAQVSGGKKIDVQIAGRGGVPASGVDAVVLNVTAVKARAGGFLTVAPTGGAKPNVSNVNYQPGLNTPNLVMCKLSSDGKVTVFVSGGAVDVLADVVGCYVADGDEHVPVAPTRILDTRSGTGAPQARLGAEQELTLKVTGGRVPPEASAVLLNVTAVKATASSFITVYPNGTSRPETSNLNLVAGQTAPNLVVAKVGTSGSVKIFNASGSVDMIADVTGFYL